MGPADIVLALVAIAAIAVWLAFVPRVLRFDARGMEVGFALRARRRLDWKDLQSWHEAAGMLRLRFSGGRVTILLAAYPAAQRAALRALLPRGG